MGKERVTFEVDTELMDRLRAAGVDPVGYLERLLRRKMHDAESEAERQARWARWRADHKGELDSYDSFIREHGLWCEDHNTD